MSVPPLSPSEASSVGHADARWFAEEVKPHEPRLRAWLTGRFPRLRDVDDIVQEAYVRLLRARHNGGVRSVRTFLFLAARNAACDVFRRQRPEFVAQAVAEAAVVEPIAHGPDAAEVAAANQELELLAEAMRQLPARCRQVLTLRKIFGLSQKEIAAQLGISEHTVEIHVCKGTRRCAEYLRARGVERR